MKYTSIIMLGKPGSGKGTQAQLLSAKTGFEVFSTSGHLRTLAASNPDIGETILNTMKQGLLVPHWIISYLWISTIFTLSRSQGIIFDGAVRKPEESSLFDEVMKYVDRPYAVVCLHVSDQELRARIMKRAHIENRVDDTEEVVTRRLEEYENNTRISIDFFRRQGTLIEVDGVGTIEEVHERVMQSLS